MVELKEHNGVSVHGVSDASSDAENGGVFTLNSKNVRHYGKTSKMIEEMCDEFSEKHESCEPYEVRVPSCWFVRKPNARLVFKRTNNIYNGGILVNVFNGLNKLHKVQNSLGIKRRTL